MVRDQIRKFTLKERSEPFQRWLSTLLFLPLLIYFRFVIGTSLILDKDFVALSRTLGILGAVFLIWLGWKWLFDQRLVVTGLEIYLGGFFLVCILSTAFSANTSLSVEKLIGISCYLLGVYLLLDIKRSSTLWGGLTNGLVITAGLSSMMILISAYPWIKIYQLTPLQIITNPFYVLKALPRLPYSLGFHQSVTAGYLVMILPLAVYQFSRTKNILGKALQFIGIIFNFSVLILTQSRGGLLGLGLLVITSVLLYRKEIWTFLSKHKALGLLAGSVLGLSIIGFVLFLAKSRGFSISDPTLQMRFNQWQVALRIIRENPWLGSGLGTYGQKYLELRDPAFFPGTFIHAHNQLIQITTELGLLGLIILLILIWQGIRLLRGNEGDVPDSSKAALITLGGIFGVLIPDAIFTNAMIVFLLIFNLVWLLPSAEPLQAPVKSRGLSLLSLAAVLLASGAGWMLWKIQPYHLALGAAEEANWPQASAALAAALERDPQNPYYQHALGYTEGQTACQAKENASRALSYYQESFETYQNWGIDQANAAVLYSLNGDYQSAAEHMEIAAMNFPQNSFFYCLLGDYHYQSGNAGDATASYVHCISQSPQLVDSPFWQEDRDRKELFPAVFDQAEAELKSRGDADSLKSLAELYFAAGELEKADRSIQDYLKKNPEDLRANIILFKILESRGELSGAGEKIEQLIRNNPRYPDLWIFKGLIAEEKGNLMDAEAAFLLGYRLQPTPERSWILGMHYASQGDLGKAREFYSTALSSTPSPMMDFSRRIAGRWPLKGEYLDCLPIIWTYDMFFSPAITAAQAVEGEDCPLAACIYGGLLTKSPHLLEAQYGLDSLTCSDDFNPDQCFADQNE